MGRVAFIADQIAHWHAGTERQMLLLGNGLAAAGWEVPLIVLRDTPAAVDGRWPGNVEQAGITRVASPRSWLRAMAIARRLRRNGFRVAQLFFNDTSVIMPWCLRLCGIRVVVSRRDMGFWYTPGILRMLRINRPAVDAVVANSRAVGDHVCRHEGYDRDRLAVFHNGLVADAMAHDGSGPEPAGPVIGLVANIRPIKRIEDAIEAFARIADRHPDACLRIVGRGDASALQARADRLGLNGRVEFTGGVTDASRQIASFSIALLTSESEGFSNALIEYMHAAKPVICTDSGGNAELVEDGRSGYLCKVGDVDGIARCLDRLLSNPAARRDMGLEARWRVAALCDPRVMLERHAALYQRLTGARRGPVQLTTGRT